MYKGATAVEPDSGAAPPSGGGSLPYRGATPARADSGLSGGSPTRVDPTDEMPWYEKVLEGAKGGLTDFALGAKQLVGQGSEFDSQHRKDWEKGKGKLGGWGMVGEGGIQALATAPIGGVVGATGKVLSKAVPALAKFASPGSWSALAARGGAEGAASNIIGGPEDKSVLENAQSGGVTGAVVGSVLPKFLKGTGQFIGASARELSPTAGAAAARSTKILERTLGKDEMDNVVRQLESPSPSMLPRTSAAMSGSRHLGALERGARNRRYANFDPHDEAVARKAWGILQDATDNVDQIPSLQKGVNDIMGQGKELLSKIPLTQDKRDDLAQELLRLGRTDEVIANPNLRKEINNAIEALDNPDATTALLPQLSWRLNREAGDSTVMQQVQKKLQGYTDDISGGEMTNINAGYGATMDQLKAAEAAKRLRGKFTDELGTPSTTPYYGSSGVDAVPSVTSGPLRLGMIAETKKGNTQLMDPNKVNEMNVLADQLRQHEIYKPSASAGGSGLNMGEAEGAASAALNAGPLWRLRGVLGSAFGQLNEASQKKIDDALLNPDAFLSLIDAKKARREILDPIETTLDHTLRGLTRANATN